jgi:hypothetical protein
MSKEELRQVFDNSRGITRGSPRSMREKKTHLRLEKAQSNGRSHKRMLNLIKSCAKVPNTTGIPMCFYYKFWLKKTHLGLVILNLSIVIGPCIF